MILDYTIVEALRTKLILAMCRWWGFFLKENVSLVLSWYALLSPLQARPSLKRTFFYYYVTGLPANN